MELCAEGELYRLLKKKENGCFSENEARPLFVDVCRGLHYLHRKAMIIHRDLKLSNILLSRDDSDASGRRKTAKIGDFGLASRLRGLADHEQMTICGTPNYLAPEVVQKRPYGQEADIWSLGCLLYTMLVGRPPFEGRDVRTTFAKVNIGHFTLPDFLSFGVRELLLGMMNPEVKDRLTLEQILEHPYVLSSPPLLPCNPIVTNATINTKRLKPLRQTIKHGTIEIDAYKGVIFTVTSDKSVMTVSPDGSRISFKDGCGRSEECKLEELGRAARKRYDYMRRFVDLVRSKTPHIILRTDSFKMLIMESLRDAVMNINTKGSLCYSSATDTVTVCLAAGIANTNGGGASDNVQYYYHPTYRSIEAVDNVTSRKWLLEFLTRLEQLKRVMSTLTDASNDSLFPFVIDETSKTATSSLLDSARSSGYSQPSSSHITGIVKSFESGQLSGISTLVQRPTLPQFQFADGIGWKAQLADSIVCLLLNDGTSVHVNVQSRSISIDGGRWHSFSDRAIPEHVRKALHSFSLLHP